MNTKLSKNNLVAETYMSNSDYFDYWSALSKAVSEATLPAKVGMHIVSSEYTRKKILEKCLDAMKRLRK